MRGGKVGTQLVRKVFKKKMLSSSYLVKVVKLSCVFHAPHSAGPKKLSFGGSNPN